MAKLLTTKGISFFLDELFKTSKEYVYIVTPYFKIDKQLEERIFEAIDNGLKVILIYGKEKSQINQIDFKSREKLEIRFYENLHAKFYINEKHVLITSMNMHSFSQANNREIGVLFAKKDINDFQVFEDCLKEFESIKKHAENQTKSNFKPIESQIIKQYKEASQVEVSKFNIENKSVPKEENNIAPLESSEFENKWIEYLKRHYPEINFLHIDNILTAKDFPLNTIDFSMTHGFITLKFNTDLELLEKIINKEKLNLRKELNNYRFYWNKPNKISIYHSKNIVFKNTVDEINYCSIALEKIKAELERIYIPVQSIQ